jgi:hypothetical protein
MFDFLKGIGTSSSSETGLGVGFEDVKHAIKAGPTKFILINTFEQDSMIQGTVSSDKEETVINAQLTDYTKPDIPIIVYGRNSVDDSVDRKEKQLRALGLEDIYIYRGGMFEWLLLGDVFGTDEFPVSVKVVDILKFAPGLGLMSH